MTTHPTDPLTFVPRPPAIRRPRLPDQAQEVRRVIDAGLLAPGDRLVWRHTTRRRDQHEHVAFVLADGRLTVDGTPYGSPSRSARAACPGRVSVNGWTAWTREHDHVSLEALRREIGDDPR